jgi:hypothetical protein
MVLNLSSVLLFATRFTFVADYLLLAYEVLYMNLGYPSVSEIDFYILNGFLFKLILKVYY